VEDENKIEEFLTTREAARYLGLAPVTLEKWRYAGTGPNHCHFGYAVRYSQKDLDDYARRCKIRPKPKGAARKTRILRALQQAATV